MLLRIALVQFNPFLPRQLISETPPTPELEYLVFIEAHSTVIAR